MQFLDKLTNKITLINFSHNFDSSVDLGCGRFPRNPFNAKSLIGCDIFDFFPNHPNNFEYRKVINTTLPLSPNSVDVVTAFDFLEHIPRIKMSDETISFPFIEMMNEIHKILKPGGYFLAITPCYPSPSAFTDPTHVNFITPQTVEYFSNHNFANSLGYGFIGKFNNYYCGWTSFLNLIWQDNIFSEVVYRNRFKIKILDLIYQIKFFLFSNKYIRSHYVWILQKP